MLAALTTHGMGPAMVVTGTTDTSAFLVYIEHVRVPTLRAGHIVVLDNLSVHHHSRVRELVEAAGGALWYLPGDCKIDGVNGRLHNLLTCGTLGAGVGSYGRSYHGAETTLDH
jgi:hypothetical protein